ncbi:cell division protein ZapA [Pseudotabrizicola algicola]|uniref:Cell division protein ZapA n=1 Tax=Pseudotabrizicola algicola TaxID=2709381 RepID=A0A6B3RFL0_9RHOB|nr:cell division protein ZapA [Pseudotabrizicola algicola]NEX44884.1 cell division protein ZapA [Pseudotabrizicola algicola]
MPDVTVTIGGRDFQVACQAGEEHFLRAAAAMLNAEAEPLVQQMGRLPEARMLLMSGLMLADKTAAVEDENRQLKERVAALEARAVPPPEKVEVPVIPPQVFETMAEIAARAEALADRIEEKAQA